MLLGNGYCFDYRQRLGVYVLINSNVQLNELSSFSKGNMCTQTSKKIQQPQDILFICRLNINIKVNCSSNTDNFKFKLNSFLLPQRYFISNVSIRTKSIKLRLGVIEEEERLVSLFFFTPYQGHLG